MHRGLIGLVAVVIGFETASCTKRAAPQVSPAQAGATLWQQPGDLGTRDLYSGPWGARNAPDPNAVYTLVERKHSGVNLGMDVVDPQGREWSVKQGYPSGLDDEGPAEVVLSRLLSAVGYHQPPVYYLRSFTLKDDWGTHTERGGRFRLKDETLKEVGPWRWEENPFVGTRPYQGLLVIMMMVNSTDLKNSNNSLYERRSNGQVERWYVVRDIGSALGDTDFIAARKNHPDSFERHPFILGVRNGYVDFASHTQARTLVRDRVTREDVAWASSLLGRLSDRQWQDAFRAAGYTPQVAGRFIRKLREKIQQGEGLSRRGAA